MTRYVSLLTDHIMPAERFYLPQELTSGADVCLEGQEYHHLARVMRVREGEQIELVNGKGQLAIATVVKLDKRDGRLAVETLHTAPNEDMQMILMQGLPRHSRLDTIIEKGTELGVTEFRLFPAVRGEVKEIKDNQMERLQTLTIAAMKQCGRLFLPAINFVPPIKKWGKDEAISLYFGDTRKEAPYLIQEWQKARQDRPVAVCIGPESGLTPEEVGHLESLGAVGIKLHPNILRTETASICAMSILSQLVYS